MMYGKPLYNAPHYKMNKRRYSKLFNSMDKMNHYFHRRKLVKHPGYWTQQETRDLEFIPTVQHLPFHDFRKGNII